MAIDSRLPITIPSLCRSCFSASRSRRLSTTPGGPALKRVMGAGDLIMLAIGAVIGAGIFSSIGTAAAGEILPVGRGRALRRRARRWSCRSSCSASSAGSRRCATRSSPR